LENKYQNVGFLTRKDYLDTLSKRYNIEKETVYEIAAILGEDEDFDGLFGLFDDYNNIANKGVLYNLWCDITDYKEEANRNYYLTSKQLQDKYDNVKAYKDNVPKSTYQYNNAVDKKYKDVIKRRNAGLSGNRFSYPKPALYL
jgi:hypothetical protein